MDELEAGYLAQIKLFLGASSPEDAFQRIQALQNAFDRARGILGSIFVVAVIMGNGEALGVQLPAGSHTEESLTSMADGLLQGAVHLRELAKQRRASAQGAGAE